MSTGHGKILLVVFFTVFLDLIGFGIIIPVQPFFAEMLGASPTVVTWLGASFSLMQFLFAPFWGRLSDKVGRRPIMLVSIATSCLGYLLFAFSETLWMLFAARMLAGFGAANIGTAQAIVADVTPGGGRAKGMGLIGAAFGLGFTLGPAIGGVFAQYGLATPAFVASGLCGLNLVLAFFILRETNPIKLGTGKSPVAAAKNRPGFSLAAIKHAARHVNVGRLFFLTFLFTVAFSMMEQVMGLFVERVWVVGAGFSGEGSRKAAELTAYVLIVIGITSIIIQGGLIGRLVKRFGERTLLQLGTFLVALSLFLIPVVGASYGFASMLWVALLMAVGSGISNPSLHSLISRSVDADEQGGVMGLNQSLSALGRVVGPAMAGFLFEVQIGVPFWLGGGLILICTWLAFGVAPVAKETA